MQYQEFLQKNNANKKNYQNAVKSGQYNPNQANANPYMSFSIDSVSFSKGDGVAAISSNTRSACTNMFIAEIVKYVCNTDFIHVTNPSRLKGWRHFD